MSVKVKICGLNSPQAAAATAEAGADYAGFMFYPPSPRYVAPEDAARLAGILPASVARVPVTVNADDDQLAEIVAALKPDLLQLHGAETPERVRAVRERFSLPVMKAIAVAAPEDVEAAALYEEVADLLLFDAKPPKSMPNALPGGNGLAFDWALIAGYRSSLPWMLSGGLTVDLVGEAIRLTGAQIVDVSSGVEDRPGVKNPDLIHAFVRTAKAAA